MVGLRTSRSNLGLIGQFFGQNVYPDANLTVVDYLSIIFQRLHVDPERVLVFVKHPNRLSSFSVFGLYLIFVISLSERDGLLGQCAIFKDLLKVDLSASDDVVALEEVTVIGLNREQIRSHFVVVEVFSPNKTVVPTRFFTRLQAVMCVSLESVLAGIKEHAHEHITAIFNVHHLDVFSVEDRDTELELFWRFRLNVPDRQYIFWGNLCFVDLDPHSDEPLGNVHARVVKFTRLYGFILQCLPLRQEVAIFQVDDCGAD